MTYVTGTITSSDSVIGLYNAIEPALIGAGFTLVDTLTVGARTHKVWKSAAASNSRNQDWFLDCAFVPTGTGNLTLWPMEFYDPATHLAYRMAGSFGGTTGVPDATTYSKYGATGYALEHANWLPSPTTASLACRLATSTASFGYWFSATPDRVIGLSSLVPTQVLFSGFYTPTEPHASWAGAAAYPLVYCLISGQGQADNSVTSANATIMLTRYPKWTASVTWANMGHLEPSRPVSQATVSIPAGSTYTLGARYGVDLTVYAADSPSTGAVGGTGPMGVLPSILMTLCASTVVRGDTVTVAGVTYVCTTAFAATGVWYTTLMEAV
jgi:hypothetical protein